MTDRREALEALRDHVKAGVKYETMGHTIMCQKAFPKPDDFDGSRKAYANSPAQLAILVWRNDDLNAAMSLHDAVLHHWFWDVSNVGTCEVKRVKDDMAIEAVSAVGNPARAWLLAILSALISETPDTPKRETP